MGNPFSLDSSSLFLSHYLAKSSPYIDTAIPSQSQSYFLIHVRKTAKNKVLGQRKEKILCQCQFKITQQFQVNKGMFENVMFTYFLSTYKTKST